MRRLLLRGNANQNDAGRRGTEFDFLLIPYAALALAILTMFLFLFMRKVLGHDDGRKPHPDTFSRKKTLYGGTNSPMKSRSPQDLGRPRQSSGPVRLGSGNETGPSQETTRKPITMKGDVEMNGLSVFIPYVMPVMSMMAAFTVVSVATLRILRSSYPRKTAVVLSLGVTIMSLLGTAPIVFFQIQRTEVTELRFPNSGTLMLLPFLTLAISRLISELLVTASGRASERGLQPAATEIEASRTVAAPSTKQDENTASKTKPRGRPKKQQPPKAQGDKQVKHSEDKRKVAPAVATAKEGGQGMRPRCDGDRYGAFNRA